MTTKKIINLIFIQIFHSNPFDLYKSNESDEESSPKVRPKPKPKPIKVVEEPKKKKTYEAKLNDFNKFRESDKIVSDSESSEPSNEVKNKNEEKKELNRSVDSRRNNKNKLFNQYTNYFFDENAINEEKLRNRKNIKIKENKTNVEKINKKKGFYHYQNNPNKEVKTILDKKFEIRTRNPGVLGFNQANTYVENYNNNRKINNGNSFKKKKIVKQNSNDSRKLKTVVNVNEKNNSSDIYENDMLIVKMKNGRNKKNEKEQNNTIAYNHDINLTKSDIDENDLNKTKKLANHKKNMVLKVKNEKIRKKSSKKLNKEKTNVVQNLMDDFEQTMEEYTSLYTENNATSRGKKTNKAQNDNKNNLRKTINNRTIKNKKNTSNELDDIDNNHSVVLNTNINNINQSGKKDEKNTNKTTEGKRGKNRIIKDNTKRNKINKKSEKDTSEFDIENSDHISGTIIKIKKSKANMKYNLKDDLPLFRGEIDYNNVSIKSIEDSIDDLMIRYKKKGYTCVKKGNTQFKFIKGPNVHHVEIMRLGNGLLYFNVTK